MAIVLNCDMGEAFGLYRCGDDEGIMPLIHVANVACGFHASDPSVMRKTVRLAKQHGVKVGAHPSFPDLQGFGRREMKMGHDELVACIVYQVGALKTFLDLEGMPLNHVKPHGALYGAASRDATVAGAIAEAVALFGVPVMGMAGTVHEEVYKGGGLAFIPEYYTDLDYTDEGKLIITREHEAKDPDEAARRAVRVAKEGLATSINGKDLPMRAECYCIHSDTPTAVPLAKAVREALKPWLA
ncbi:LamB/YcsF family protein [Lichenifustis flavocetrariae]|uniref:LamB/YcsF family protein n=1 Tax=Lichenifustis flavocetrariae TaxID=2949735 RepID=A0AA41YW87_9HYPH|nr:LamB/YcsF family protein [Lichenifustis flavocetrariae]MCW6508302.1 LamB/YcsF family protein [Lichenifustis flavocetrariae]